MAPAVRMGSWCLQAPDGGVGLLKTIEKQCGKSGGTEQEGRPAAPRARHPAAAAPAGQVLMGANASASLPESARESDVAHCADFPFCLSCQDAGNQMRN